MKCKSCMFWSELMAKLMYGVVVAMCENKQSPNYLKYVASGCEKGESD